MIFFDAHELFRVLCKEYDTREKNGPVSVDIATYGISLFDEKHESGYSFESNAKRLLRRLMGKGLDVRILIGLPPIKKFSGADYGLSEIKYIQKIAEVLRIGEEYGVCCLPIANSHLKMYRINDLYVTGGINFSNSYWTDCSVMLENPADKEQLQYVFDCSWEGASTVRPLYSTAPYWMNISENKKMYEEAWT